MWNSLQTGYKAFITMRPEFYFELTRALIWGLASGFLSAYVAKKKGYPYKLWFAIGFFGRLYGLIAIAGLPPKET
jgi:hypothetical protein